MISIDLKTTIQIIDRIGTLYVPIQEPVTVHTCITLSCPCLCARQLLIWLCKTQIYIHCSCLIAPLRGYMNWHCEDPGCSFLMITDWLLRHFIKCDYLHVLTLWLITASVQLFWGCGYNDAASGISVLSISSSCKRHCVITRETLGWSRLILEMRFKNTFCEQVV